MPGNTLRLSGKSGNFILPNLWEPWLCDLLHSTLCDFFKANYGNNKWQFVVGVSSVLFIGSVVVCWDNQSTLTRGVTEPVKIQTS